uniref:DUF4220 domain-containing protein n=1 Tax=Aegilops tauschii TaxID=37682 RepID=M8AXK0_AEGTA
MGLYRGSTQRERERVQRRWINSHSFKHMETAEAYKYTALSFTLFKMLKRRFCGYRISEAGLEKSLHLVLDGLLSENGNYVRAFRVIEEDLSFLYDFFYTRMESATFKKNNGKLENGQSALVTNQLRSQFSWAFTLPTHIHTILVWHIATTIFRNKVPLEGNDDLLVAVNLSDYCAYLVAFIPDTIHGASLTRWSWRLGSAFLVMKLWAEDVFWSDPLPPLGLGLTVQKSLMVPLHKTWRFELSFRYLVILE